MKDIEALGITKSGGYLFYDVQSHLHVERFVLLDIFVKLDSVKILEYYTDGIVIFTGIINTQQRRMLKVAYDLHFVKEPGTLAFKLGDGVRVHDMNQDIFTCM